MQCFITRWNAEKRVENTMRSGVFLTNFEVFHLVMKHCELNAWYYISNKVIILEGEIKDAKMSSFTSDFQTLIKHNLISFVFSLWIIDEFEKLWVQTWSRAPVSKIKLAVYGNLLLSWNFCNLGVLNLLALTPTPTRIILKETYTPLVII